MISHCAHNLATCFVCQHTWTDSPVFIVPTEAFQDKDRHWSEVPGYAAGSAEVTHRAWLAIAKQLGVGPKRSHRPEHIVVWNHDGSRFWGGVITCYGRGIVLAS